MKPNYIKDKFIVPTSFCTKKDWKNHLFHVKKAECTESEVVFKIFGIILFIILPLLIT